MKFLLCLCLGVVALLADVRYKVVCEMEGANAELTKLVVENCQGTVLAREDGMVVLKKGTTLTFMNQKSKSGRVYDTAKKTWSNQSFSTESLQTMMKDLESKSGMKMTTSVAEIPEPRKIGAYTASGYRTRIESKMTLPSSQETISIVVEQEIWTTTELMEKFPGRAQLQTQKANEGKGVGARPEVDFATESMLHSMGISPEGIRLIAKRGNAVPLEIKITNISDLPGMPGKPTVITARSEDFQFGPIPAEEFVEPTGYTEAPAPQLPKLP